MHREVRRAHRELTNEERDSLLRLQQQVAEEVPTLSTRARLLDEAAMEMTFSGALRRAIHNAEFNLPQLADQVGVESIILSEFLTGERTLRSDVIDRLTAVLGCVLNGASPACAADEATEQVRK